MSEIDWGQPDGWPIFPHFSETEVEEFIRAFGRPPVPPEEVVRKTLVEIDDAQLIKFLEQVLVERSKSPKKSSTKKQATLKP